MPDYPINLGRKSDFGSPCCPLNPKEDDEMHYPPVFISSSKDLGVPVEGTMTIRFKRNQETKTTRTDDEKDKVSFDVSFDILEIVSVSSDGKKADSRDEAEAAIEKLRAELLG